MSPFLLIRFILALQEYRIPNITLNVSNRLLLFFKKKNATKFHPAKIHWATKTKLQTQDG